MDTLDSAIRSPIIILVCRTKLNYKSSGKMRTVTLVNNVPIETISKMMGHKSLNQTQHYAKVLAIKVTDDRATLKKTLAKNKFIPDQKIMIS